MTTHNLLTLSEFRTRRDADARAEYAERLPLLKIQRKGLGVAKERARRIYDCSDDNRNDLERLYECWLALATDYWRTDTTIRAIEVDLVRLEAA